MALELLIAGTDRVGKLQPGTLRIRQNLRSVGGASFTLHDATSYHPLVGESVVIKKDAAIIFGGSLQSVAEGTVSDSTTQLRIQCEAVDYNYWPERFLVADSFANKTQGEIIKEIVAETALSTLGITTTNVLDGVNVEKATVPYKSAANTFDEIARLTEWSWWIDNEKNLYFDDSTVRISPHHYGPSTRPYVSLEVSTSRTGYANRITLRAGKDLTDSRTDSLKGDGERGTFTLPFEASDAKPVIVVNSTTIAPADIGVHGVDKELDDNGDPTNFEFFYEPESKEIRHNLFNTSPNSGIPNVPLESTDTLNVTYQGLFHLLVQADNEIEQANRLTVEGGSGIYEEVRDERTIDGRDNALDRATGLLSAIDKIPVEIQIETDDEGFAPGQWMLLNIAEHNLNGVFVIDEVVMLDMPTKDLRFRSRLKLRDVGQPGRATTFWKRLEEQGREFVIRENETLQLLKKDTVTLSLSDGITVDQSDTLIASSADVESWFAIGTAVIGAHGLRSPTEV